jgi:hypothetical protein
MQDTERLRTLRDLMEDTKEHITRLIKAVNELNIKSYSDTSRELIELKQTVPHPFDDVLRCTKSRATWTRFPCSSNRRFNHQSSSLRTRRCTRPSWAQ